MSFPVVEIGFILSQRHCRFLFISVVAGLLILLQRQVTTDNDLMETRLKAWFSYVADGDDRRVIISDHSRRKFTKDFTHE